MKGENLVMYLRKKYNLSENDTHTHRHYIIITRPGIEKIQYHLKIKIKYEVVYVEKNLVVVKAVGLMTNDEGERLILETLASASDQNSQNNYYAEMAEKRAKSRIVLQMAGLYKEGVFGEDEADDFKKSKNYSNNDSSPSYDSSSSSSKSKYASKFLKR